MKKIIYIAAAAAALAAMSCTRELELNTATDLTDQSVKLSFSCGNLATKADGDDVATVNNEDRVNRIDFFIFPLNVDANGKMIGSTEYVYKGELVPEAQAEDNKYTKNITNDPDFNLNKIFPAGAKKAMIFAVANYTSKEGITETTWEGLHSLEVGDTFTKDAGEGFGKRWPHPMETDNAELYFVMTGEKEIQLATNSTQYAIQETIPMNRLASKVTVEFDYTHSVYKDEKGVTWVPENLLDPKPAKQEARVYMSNAFCHATLGGPQTRTPIVPDGYVDSKYVPRPDRDIFEYAYDFLADAKEGQLHYYYTYPYPAQIDNGDNQPYLKLVLPWYGYKNYGTDNEVFFKKKEVYYKIVLPSNSITESNKLYQYKVDVRIIGSETEVEVTGEEYRVKEWLSNDGISSSVATGRYISLDIPKDTYDMYSSLAEIVFVSSGDVEVIVNSIYQLNLGGSKPVKEYFMRKNVVTDSTALLTKKGISKSDVEKWVTIPKDSSYLKISHVMDNRLRVNGGKNKAFDMSPYIYNITLHLVAAGTDTSFDRTITVTQYPSMYVTSTKSNGIVWVNAQTWDPNNQNNSYMPVGNRRMYATPMLNSSNQGIGSVANPEQALITSTNNNGYNMIVHPTIIDEDLTMSDGTHYVLGESRVSTGGPLSGINGLSNYKPTRDDVRGIVSPGFIIASSYGKTTSMLFDRAKQRCASYQENGYPAGRWRIPSPGEINFLVELSNNGFIPSLFDGEYWAANGQYYNSGDSRFHDAGRSDTQAVRCVYDVWYWGEEPVATGDEAKEWLLFRDNN